MPIGPFGEIVGTTGTLEGVAEGAKNYKSNVVVPRNPKVVKPDEPGFKMTPSIYMFQMSLDTEKKLANTHDMRIPKKVELLDMGETTYQLVSHVSIDECMFQPFPSEVFFQNYKPFETYEIPLVLRNNDKVPRLVKVTQADSPYFKIISPNDVGHKVGPGLPRTFRILFTPDQIKDYNHELVCVTEREKFIVPVKCIGARALLDFPDEVNFPVSPVKYPSTKTLLVRNIGNMDAKFDLKTEEPFKVSPLNGVLPVNESMQVTIEFKPMTVGDHCKDLILHLDTGEDIYISCYGAAQDANVRLDKNSIRIENTYISMANQRTITIINRSDVIAHFHWTQFATQQEEDMQKMRYCQDLEKEEMSETDRFLEECISDPTLRDKMSVLSRTFQNRKKLIGNDKMLFSDNVVRIEPVEGDIWPNSSAEVTMIFKPDQAKNYTRTAFCDVTGRESRLPLRIQGVGMGPKVQFSFDVLDMGNIFVNSTHSYEVVLANKGDIDAIFTLLPNNSIFGPRFTFNPSESIVMPGGHQAIQITFNSPILGDFQEDFYFQVDGQPEKLKLTFSGSVIGPTFHFDVPKLEFGTISYGFVNTRHCTLVNTALVPMTFNLRVPGDGISDSISSLSDYDSNYSEAGSMLPPKEFEVVPSTGTLQPQSEVRIQVNVTSNTVKKYDMALVVDVDGVGDEVVSLPITARCVVPPITVLTPILDYGRCFLRHPYERYVKLHNDTDLPAKYELLVQQVDEMTTIFYHSPQPKGILAPNSVMDVPLIIEPQGLEELECVALFLIFGSGEVPLPVQLICIGEGPVVHVTPLQLDWGQMPVLTDVSKTIKLSNESLIPAKFTAHMVRPNSNWCVEPREGEIPAEEVLELTVTANLDDCVRFQDKLQVNFLEGQSRTIPVTGYGYGTTIATDPPMAEGVNLGPYFSKNPCRKVFRLTNKGRRLQQLVWTTEGYSLLRAKRDTVEPDTKDVRYKNMPPAPEPWQPIFKLTPARIELVPGESQDVVLEGYVDMPQNVHETLLCHAIIGRSGGKELIMRVDIRAEFISPLLDFSSRNVFFRVDKHPEEELSLQTQDFTLSNVSSLPLNVMLGLKYPFQLVIREGQDKKICSEMEMSLAIGESQTIRIQFDPSYKDDFHIRTAEEVLTVAYKEHPHVDYIALRGEVYFPNLEFEKSVINFGCILNDTEVTRYVNITNNSPMEVKYKWCFLIGDEPCTVFHKRQTVTHQVIGEELEEYYEEGQSQGRSSQGEGQPEGQGQQVEVEIQDSEQYAQELEESRQEEKVREIQSKWVVSLPITARCVVPPITVLTPILDYGRCFLRHPYERYVKLHNDTDLPAKYELLVQQVDEMTTIFYHSPQPKGILAPNSVMDVPLIIEPQGLEELECVALFLIFGSGEVPLPVQLICIGEGPVVHVTPLQLDWGQMPVLTDVSKTIKLSNESLIPAKFTAHMVRPNSNWCVEPREGEIPAEEVLELTVTANLDDCVRFQDKLQVNFLEGQSRTIPVTGYGYGTTIATDPPMAEGVNLGPYFSKNPCRKVFRLTNKGRRLQQLVWTTEGYSLLRAKRDTVEPDTKDVRYKNMPPAPEPWQPIFKLTPARIELVPGESQDVVLEGYVDMPQNVHETLLCHAIIGRSGGKELIMRVDIRAEFISPLLDFSSRNVFFRVDKHPEEELSLQTQDFTLSNVSSLPLTIMLGLKYPFQLIIREGQDKKICSEMEMSLAIGESQTIRIQFDPSYKDDFHIRTAEEVLTVAYKEHPHVDYIALRGEVYFPNLEFEKSVINFGCILNDTEVTRYVNITNNSPMEVKYKWCFLIGDEPCTVFHKRQTVTHQVIGEELEEYYEEGQSQGRSSQGEGQPEGQGQQVEVEIQDSEQYAQELEESRQEEKEVDKELMLIIDEDQKDLDTEKGSVHKADSEKAETDRQVSEKGGSPQMQEAVEKLDLGRGVSVQSRQSRAMSRMDTGTPKPPVLVNAKLAELMDREPEEEDLGVEEIFDILPLYGTLKSGDTEQITLTFYGHADIGSKARAICEVEGGPTYVVELKGEASLVQYAFDCQDIDYGKQMYDQVAETQITLINTGKVGFNFTAINMDPSLEKKPRAGVPVMIPHTGYIEPFSELILTVKYLPGVPERFHRSFQIQVAHFEPDTINIYGEGVFPRISLDLPRVDDNDGRYSSQLKEARELLSGEKKCGKDPFNSLASTLRETHREDDNVFLQPEGMPSELELQMEVERLMVKEYAMDQLQQSNRSETHDTSHVPTTHDSKEHSKKGKRKKNRPRLPDYLLDFGYVVLGTVRTHIVRATNSGWYPASFSVDHEQSHGTGFNVELDRVKQLPGAPDHETVDFVVSFDPRGANLPLGDIDTVVPITIVNGPQINVRLHANVTMPEMTVSADTLEFGEVKCGECKIITIQLYNHKFVRCEWNSLPLEKDKKKDKHIPMHLRRKMRQEKAKPRTFEVMPPMGVLMPGQRLNVQVKFMPTEEKYYEYRVPIRIAQSSQRLLVLARGNGLEPRLDFEKTLMEFGPILPHSPGDEREVVVRNPCQFPIEIYNLEFDKTYLEEEKVLRLMKGYDEYNTILLPPRGPSEKLPAELLEYYEDQMKKLEEVERKKREKEEAAEASRKEQEEREAAAEEGEEKAEGENGEPETPKLDIPQIARTAPSRTGTADASKGEETKEGSGEDEEKEDKEEEQEEDKPGESIGSAGVGELEITPVSAAIARHLGIDLTQEGKAARNRRGVAFIVHGAPMAGKTSSAVALAKHYEAALLTLDGVILEAISNGSTPAGLRAREMCAEAARKQAELEKLAEGMGEEGEKIKAGGLTAEAVAAHTQGTGPAAAHAPSIISNRKTSTVADHKGGKEKIKAGIAASSVDGTSQSDNAKIQRGRGAAAAAQEEDASQVPSSPPPLAAPIARRLSVSASVAGEGGLMSCVLPEELLVDILAERLQLNDCHRGVVFDGLDTLFSANMVNALYALLKALNNRKYLYFVTLKLSYDTLKEREKKEQEEKERMEKEKEEAERRRLEEMSEDEYDALTDSEKAEVDRKRLEIKKERIKREQEEKAERERREREAREAELRRLEEEKLQKKKPKKGDAKEEKGAAGKKPPGKAEPASSRMSVQKQGGKAHESEHGLPKGAAGMERPESHQTMHSDEDANLNPPSGRKKHKGSKEGKRPVSTEKENLPPEEPPKEQKSEAEILLMQKFKSFEHTQKDIGEIIELWDRTILDKHRPGTPSDKSDMAEESVIHPPSGKKGKKMDKEKGDKDKHDKEKGKGHKEDKSEAEKSAKEAAETEEGEEAAEPEPEKPRLDGIGIPHILLDCTDIDQPGPQILENKKLPTVQEILDGLGLGPNGPPVPPPAEFAVVPYPVKRRAPGDTEPSSHYVFVAASADDPNIASEEKPKEPEPEEEKSVTPDKSKEDHTTPTKSTKGSKAEKLRAGAESQKAQRKTSAGKKGGRKGSTSGAASPPPGSVTPIMDADQASTIGDGGDAKNPKLGTFRWVIPANGEVTIRLRFLSEELGQFDQTLNFEIVGTRRRYQLYCRGICAFPNISREPRIVFQHRKKNKKSDEIVSKKYILMNEVFEFGPLLVGKPRDKIKEGKFPEHMEKMTIMNTSPLDADISFCYYNDSKAETFLLDPPTMLLKPGESQELSIWAYPKTAGFYEDTIVCCIRENPEPVTFKVSCHGVRPELELDKKQLLFEKVLLHRKDTKTIYLRNSTLLPVAWKIDGLESLGDDFSVSQESGIIQPKSEFALHAHFRATKATVTSKKVIRLHIMDAEGFMGMVYTETIQVHAEAYDVALDMSFPKGADGGIDFGALRVMEESKQQISLKNKGKYEIQYSFTFEPTDDPATKDVHNLFSISPAKATLSPVDRPTPVSVVFRSRQECWIRDQPILRCQVIEPNYGDGGEVIASIPVKITVKAVFSKYNIYPVTDMNFGALLVNSKKSRTFTIENKGEFDFKYTVAKMVREKDKEVAHRSRGAGKDKDAKRTKSRDGSSSGRSVVKPKKTESVRQDLGVGGGGQSRLILGMFTIFPAYGIILPNGQQVINVDCIAEQPGRCDEDIAIEISDKDPSDNPTGIPYRLMAEACIPSINLADVGSIFEEHRICKNLSVWQHSHQLESGGVYGEDENKFVFQNVIVGRKARARFKITNTNKVPCDVAFSVRPVASRHSSKHQDIFEVEPVRGQISSHSHMYATVTFTPPSMQAFNAMFEASIEGIPQQQAKGRNLVFEVAGEGNLPRITIMKPTVRNKKGQPLILFRKILIGRNERMPLLLVNDGTLPSKVDIDLVDPDGCFSMKPTGNTRAIMADGEDDGLKRPHTASVVVNVEESASFDVIFKPTLAQRSTAHVRLAVVDNQYEDSVIQLVGEGYEDDITLDNIHSVVMPVDPEKEEGNMAEEDVEAAKSNHVHFGDCYINEPRTLTFTMTNHSKTDCVRFQWPDHDQLTFSPKVGHLHAGVSKDMTVTFKTGEPKSLNESPVPCRVTKVTFDKPVNQVSDWDDRLRTVKWVDVTPPPPAQPVEPAPPAPPEKGQPKPQTPVPTLPPVPAFTPRPAKKKVIETEPEPAFTEVPDSSRTVDMLVSANSDFCKVKCKLDSIKFKDTLMFQTRVYEFQMNNKGSVQLDYNWQVVMENFSPMARSVTFATDPDRPESRASSVTSYISDIGTGYIPYSIEPECGTIAAGKKATFKVKFSPLDVHEFEARLICSVPNLEEGKQGPVIAVKGRSLMPYCHFELEDSDYISNARRNPELPGPNGAPSGTSLDPNTRVIEFHSIGVGVKNTRKFFIVNPTNATFTFTWVNEDAQDPKKVPVFNCLVPKGSVRSGKKHEITFDFIPNELDVVESFWRFIIPEHSISIPFLLAGFTKEPSISLDRSHLNYKALLIGHEAIETVYMLNNEDTAFKFDFVEESCHSAGYASHLRVEPMSGWIQPGDRLPVNLFFTPTNDKEVNFNVICNVKRKTFPITLNVKAEGYTMSCTLMCEDSSGNKVELTSNGLNEINFGEVEVNEQSVRNLFIINHGKFNFDYKWEINERSSKGHKMVSVTPDVGGVMFGEKQKCVLSFCPPTSTSLRGCELILRISNGPSYTINVVGYGRPPGLHFSFHTHNFGPCFIYRPGMPKLTTTLKVTNKDTKDISLDCLYKNSAQLHHDFEAQVLPPGKTVDINFTFYPQEVKRYIEQVTFEINGLSKQGIEIIGQGTKMKIEVANPKQKLVNFGALRVNQVVKKVIPIVNNSPAPISFNLTITPNNMALQDASILNWSPKNNITLEPKGGTCKVEVTFSPKTRITQFTEEVLLECAGMNQPLFVITGSCQGVEISLDNDAIPFGAVVQRSQSTRKLVMTNSGDIGARFHWDVEKFKPDFSISPVSGYISPGMEVNFEITFHPLELSQDIRYERLKCDIEGDKPLRLTLTGMCIGVPPVKEQQHINTHVRQKETKNIMIMNRTNMHWVLKPVIEGEYFSGPEIFEVEPQQTKPFELCYRPLTLTPEGKKHLGSIFFPLPDGTGLMYNLVGSSDPPKVNARITRDVPCKTSYTEILSVNNWLKRPQRFRVKFDPLKPDKLDSGTTLKGLDYIDVPGNTKKDYKLTFYAHKEGQSVIKVTFTNEQTGEYQYYELTYRATKPDVIATIELTTPVRQTVQHTIELKNPLTYSITFAASCDKPEVLMPSQLVVPGETTGYFNLEYLPLKVGEETAELNFISNDLGQYNYILVLKAAPAGPEKALYFRSCLGLNQVQQARFLNFAKSKTDYACKIDNPDFHCEKSVPAAPGSSGGTWVALDVTYEPSRIGESRGTLTITSPTGGDYTFPLFGTAIPPKPQGPFIIKAGSTTSITFRNVFMHTTPFTFQVDNPLFHVTKSGENIRSRKDHRIVVGFDGNDSGTKAAVMGKLIVTCARSAGGSSNVQWVYYLKGITP
ncbi:hydrocephalus-inducing protein [Lingula anatina]|uniref:Hydrocephalus-inducing protein n=1 Tax=Lingula anatina TaxID=7574 RepID=A0A1S3J5T2_LINAN|nr:hydrocephalus-inducing protein [Lingula anatina]|eukprot:XP_013405663.1 hydrocephalus-inducing protein [Lingula anatina]